MFAIAIVVAIFLVFGRAPDPDQFGAVGLSRGDLQASVTRSLTDGLQGRADSLRASGDLSTGRVQVSQTADLTSPVARPRTSVSLPTLQCNAACTDCGTDSNPRARGRLSLENICRAIDEASEDGFVVVVFTGGEATLARRELLAGIEYAAGRGLPTRLVTNGHWSRSEDSARRRIAEWCQAGLNEINFSTGDEHVRVVSIYRVATAARLSVEAGLRVSIMVEYRSDSTVTRRDLEALLDVDNLRRNYPDSYLSIMRAPGCPCPHTRSPIIHLAPRSTPRTSPA